MADPTSREARAAAVLALMETGKSMKASCREADVAPGTFMGWVGDDADLADRYARARDSMIDAIADDLMAIADAPPAIAPLTGAVDSGDVAHKRLQVDTRKWLLSKLAPKRYGDRLEVVGDPDAPLVATIRRVVVDPVCKVPDVEAKDS